MSNINCLFHKMLENGELLMNFQTLINPLGITLLAELIITLVMAVRFLISNETHMATVSWNG